MKRILEILILTVLLLSSINAAFAADPDDRAIESITLTLAFKPSLPIPVQDSLHSVILATLQDVLIEQKPGGIASLQRHARQVSLAIQEGLNVVLEPKGFIVSRVDLDIAPVTGAEIEIIPAGGTQEQPGPACENIEIVLATDDIPEFWRPILLRNLETVRDDAEAYYAEYIIGLPLAVSDKSFISDALEPYISDADPLADAFPYYKFHTRLELAPTSRLHISPRPLDGTVKRLRVRMSGDTVPNFVLDALREAITSQSDVVVGMPSELVMANLDRIGRHFAAIVEADKYATFFNATASINSRYEELDDSLIMICEVRSRIYDLNLRGYIDFGLEDADSSEVEGRFGYFVSSNIELMLVLNLFTTDMTLEPDALVGWRPEEGSFFAGGYDIDAKDSKFFFSQRIGENIFCEGEIFAENERNQFGVLYRFHQYFSGGVFATGDGDYWFRTTFRL